MLALTRQSVIKLTPVLREGGEFYEAAGETLNYVTSTSARPAHPQYEEVTWQSVLQEPLDMRVNQPFVIARNEKPTWGFPQPILSSRDNKNSKESVIKDCSIYPVTYSSTSFESSTIFSCSSWTPEHIIDNNPMMPFTLEEEFKVVEYIVRIDDYMAKHLIFVNKNFGPDLSFPHFNFPPKMENALSVDTYGKLPYNPAIEQRLLDFGLKFIQLNIDNFFDDMKFINTAVKMKMLETSFHATQIIFYGLLETNNLAKPLYLGPVKVGQMRMKDMERFTSPWAIDYADEVKFENTVLKVGEVLGSDLKLQTLYTMLVMITPCNTQVRITTYTLMHLCLFGLK